MLSCSAALPENLSPTLHVSRRDMFNNCLSYGKQTIKFEIVVLRTTSALPGVRSPVCGLADSAELRFRSGGV